MKALVFLNAAAGTAAKVSQQDTASAVDQALAAAGIQSERRPADREAIRRLRETASSYDVVIAAGGDGTVNSVAQQLAGGDTPLGVLPLGTLNHFAKDIGIPLELAEAARIIAQRNVVRVDVGRVNDHMFLNNASLGVYARMVLERDAERSSGGSSKLVAMFKAAFKVFRRFPLLSATLDVDGHRITRRTPLVFVGNNVYELSLLTVGARKCLTDGQLSLYIANTPSRWRMLKLAVRMILGRLEQSRDFESYCVSKCVVQKRRGPLHVALDGELTDLNPPLEFQVWPAALPVCVPQP